MLIEFSPWETTDTSLRLSLSKRKRPRVGLSTSSSSDDDFSIAASFITSRAGRRKQRSDSSARSHVLAITSSHRVSILVSKNNNGFANTGAPKTEALDAAYSLYESGKLQYSCRPGKATSFLPGTLAKEKSASHKMIPAIFDAKNDRLWALQGGSKRLVTWDAQSEGPTTGSDNGACELKEAALSLDLLPNGMVIGTCESGDIYCAKAGAGHDDKIHCHYIPRTKLHEILNGIHVGSFVSLSSDATNSNTQQMSSSKGDADADSMLLYQVYVGGCTATIVRHELATPSEANVLVGALVERTGQRVASFSLLPPDRMDEQSSVVQEASLMPSTISNTETVALYFRLSDSSQYCCSVHLCSATLTYPSFPVPCGPQQIAMITPRHLAIGINNKIQICDAFTGVVLHSEQLPVKLGGEDQQDEWVMLADARKGLLVAIYCDGEQVKVTKTLLKMDERQEEDSNPFQMSLADTISASLLVTSITVGNDSIKQPKLWTFGQNERSVVACITDGVEAALTEMKDLELDIVNHNGEGYKAGSLVSAYNRAVKEIRHCVRQCANSKDPIDADSAETLQDVAHSASKKSATEGKGFHDGYSVTPVNAEGRVNGRHVGANKAHRGKPYPINGAYQVEVNGNANGTSVEFMGGTEGTKISNSFIEQCTGLDPRGLPLSFIDVVTAEVLRLLDVVAAPSRCNHDEAAKIHHDCCVILNFLLKTGKVSARKHFEDAGDTGNRMSFFYIPSLSGNAQRPTPIHFIFTMLRHCADISESLMATMLHFLFCSSRPGDIAIALRDSKSLPEKHPYKELSSRYLDETVGPAKKSSHAENLEKLRCQVVMAGAAVLLEMMLVYSNCNPTLLSCAIRNTFSFEYEGKLLLRLLCGVALFRSNLVGDGKSDDCISSRDQVSLVGSSIQWIQALLDALPDQLQEEGDVLYLRKTLASATRQSEVMIGLGALLNEACVRSEEERFQKRRKIIFDDEETLPPYSIERLIL